MCLQKFCGGGGAHLRGYHTQKIIFHRQDINGSDMVIFNNKLQPAAESLVFIALPVKSDTDGDGEEGEAVMLRVRRDKCDLFTCLNKSGFILEQNSPFPDQDSPLA